MSFRSSTILVAIVSFSLTLGIGLWQHKREELSVPTLDTTPDHTAMRVNADTQAPANIRPAEPTVVPPVSGAQTDRPRPAIVESRTDSMSPQEGSEMPVQLGFNHRAKDKRLVARVFSSANYPLVVGVQIGSASRGTIDSQVTIPPNGAVILGGDDGLDLESGDLVTLLSHPYADKVSQAP